MYKTLTIFFAFTSFAYAEFVDIDSKFGVNPESLNPLICSSVIG